MVALLLQSLFFILLLLYATFYINAIDKFVKICYNISHKRLYYYKLLHNAILKGMLMNYTFKIDDERIKPRPDLRFYTGNINSYTFQFEFSNQWDGLIKFAIFITEKISYTMLIENNLVSIPHEILENPGVCQFGIYATNGEDNIKRISTNLIDLEILQGAYKIGESPQTPTPDVWETIFKNSIPMIIDRYWHIYNVSEDKYINTGILAEAITPIKGVDYLTPEDIDALGIDKKQDKAALLKTDDITEEINWYDSPLLYNEDLYPSTMFIPKIMNYLFSHYCPASEVNRLVSEKENTANKINVITAEASDEKYTSEKAVYDYVSNTENSLKSHFDESKTSVDTQISDITAAIWNILSDGTLRSDYSNAFSYMYDLKYPPEFKISPTNGISRMFYYYKGTEIPQNIDCSSLTFDWNTITSSDKLQPSEMFRHASNLKKIYDIGLPAMKFYRFTFHGCTQLTEIDVLRCQEDTVYAYTFAGCTRLTSLKIEGTIGTDFPISDGRMLTRKSFDSIFSALSANSSGKTISLSKNAVNKVFSQDELNEIIASKPNWTFSLI